MKKIILGILLSAITFPALVKAESTIYLIDDLGVHPGCIVRFNDDPVHYELREQFKVVNGLPRYKKRVTKCTIKNDGRLVISRDAFWGEKVYHDEVTFDVCDGDVYYVQLLSGIKCTLKVLKQKEGEKSISRADKKPDEWEVKEYEYEIK